MEVTRSFTVSTLTYDSTGGNPLVLDGVPRYVDRHLDTRLESWSKWGRGGVGPSGSGSVEEGGGEGRTLLTLLVTLGRLTDPPSLLFIYNPKCQPRQLLNPE